MTDKAEDIILKAKHDEKTPPSRPAKKYPLWKNIMAMIALLALFVVGGYWATIVYTRHGEEITMPSLKNISLNQAMDKLDALGLIGEIRDSVYNRSLQPGVVCAQSINAGDKVKQGRIIYLTINSDKAECLTLPDIADNGSYREATAKLIALGFKVTQPEYVDGEKDWVYSVKCKGYSIAAGTKVDINDPITLVVGNGHFSFGEEEVMPTENNDSLNINEDILELF